MRATSPRRRGGIGKGHHYHGVGRKIERRQIVPVTDGLIECPVCNGGVPLKTNGTLRAHAVGGEIRRGRDDIPCSGSGERP